MDHVSTLRALGLFDAKVPRYTSYPPANRFEGNVGALHQLHWLSSVSSSQPVSVYIHIPFCRRLCWFCACRTQGTKTLSPVEAYVDDLIAELKAAACVLPEGVQMGRLHLGGGTPTLLTAPLMDRLLDAVHCAFARADDFEFSVEIDPTEAASEVLETLAKWDMGRASIGVQDFHPKVQDAIGRHQTFDQTRDVVTLLRSAGVHSLNVDLLYGLPFQTGATLMETLDKVVSLRPDRLALYGYAHVPHVSKRQVMIPDEALPGAERRLGAAQLAQDRLVSLGYDALGIDHFALPSDSLAAAAHAGTLKRNFQGYTDDPCDTLLGFGASAISRFPQGYLQNAVATAAYRTRVQDSGLAAHKGYVLTTEDALIADLIDALMCYGRIDAGVMAARHPGFTGQIDHALADLEGHFGPALRRSGTGLRVLPNMWPAARLMAAHLDREIRADHIHSMAV